MAQWNVWERFTPFLEFPPELRHVIHTANAIEWINYLPNTFSRYHESG